MSDVTLDEFDWLKKTLGQKYAQWKALDTEIKFLKARFKTYLEIRDEEDRKGKTEWTTYNLKEVFKIVTPGKDKPSEKAEFFKFMRENDKEWFDNSISLNYRTLCSYANMQIESAALKGSEWQPWPHCEAVTELELGVRLRSGAVKQYYSSELFDLGFAP